MFREDKNRKRATMRKTSSRTNSVSFLQPYSPDGVPVSFIPHFFQEIRESQRLTSHILLRTCNGDWTPWRNAGTTDSKLLRIDRPVLRQLYRTSRISLQGYKLRSRIPRRILSGIASHSMQRYVRSLGLTWDACSLVSQLFSVTHWNFKVFRVIKNV